MNTRRTPSSNSGSLSLKGGRFRVLSRYGAAILVGVISLMTWGSVYYYVFQGAAQNYISKLEHRAEGIAGEIHETFDDYSVGLDFGCRLFESSEFVSRDEWKAFYDSHMMVDHFPGVLGFGFIENVEDDQLDDFVNRMRNDGAPEYTIKMDSGIEERSAAAPSYMMKYYESASRNREVWGLNVAARLESRLVYEASRDSGEIRVSDPIALMQSGEDEWGLVFAGPVYQRSMNVSTIAQRRSALIGWVVTEICFDDIFEAEWKDEWDGYTIELFTRAADADGLGQVVYSSSKMDQSSTKPNPVHCIPLDIENISLLICVQPIQAHDRWLGSGRQIGVLIAGFIIVLWLTTITWSLSRTKAKAVVIARQMTSVLRASETRQRELAFEAYSANQSKSKFLANMSHEIRTPMTAILGYGEVLEEHITEHTSEGFIEAVSSIQRSGKHLMMVINDVLDLSKIESGKLEVEIIECSLVEVIADIHTSLRIGASKKELGFEVEFGSAIPSKISTDAYRVRQILMNLVGNAIKFTDKGSIRIVLNMDDEFIHISIVDTGFGIPEAQLDELFKPFKQGECAAGHRHDSTGLGLTISRHLARLLGGDIEVGSIVGAGSRFTLLIPSKYAPGTQMVEELPTAERKRRISATPTSSQTSTELIHGRVLLAEDSIDNQKLITRVLKKFGLEVEVVENGQEAIEALSGNHRFDIVLMDINMPILDGFAATRALRKSGFNLPIVALTAHAMTGIRQDCIDAGCDEYVVKPIDRTKLYNAIRRLLDEHSPEQIAA